MRCKSVYDKIDSGENKHMISDHLLDKLAEDKLYSRKQLQDLMKESGSEVNDHTLNWMIYALQKDEKLFRIHRNAYSINCSEEKRVYQPQYSTEASKIISRLERDYPDLSFTVFESVLLNEFLNHLIAQNTVYLSVDKDTSRFIFDVLKTGIGKPVLYNPSAEEFDRYWQEDCLVILDLISRSPLEKDRKHDITIEKMLVDIIAEKCIAAVFSPHELPDIFATAAESYQIDTKKLISYSRRRNKADEIIKYLKEK